MLYNTRFLHNPYFSQILKTVPNKEKEKFFDSKQSYTTKRNTTWGMKIFQGKCVCCKLYICKKKNPFKVKICCTNYAIKHKNPKVTQCQSLKYNSLFLDWNMEVFGATLDMQTVNVSTLANPHHGDLFSVCQTNITQRYYRDT